jgi:hypothetical protein
MEGLRRHAVNGEDVGAVLFFVGTTALAIWLVVALIRSTK